MSDLDGGPRRGKRTIVSARRAAVKERERARRLAEEQGPVDLQLDVGAGSRQPTQSTWDQQQPPRRPSFKICFSGGPSVGSSSHQRELEQLLQAPPSPHTSDEDVSGGPEGRDDNFKADDDVEEDDVGLEDNAPGTDVPPSSSFVLVCRSGDERFRRPTEPSRSTGAESKRKRIKGRRDGSWMLQGPAEGGPKDPSVIPSYNGHIAHRLYTDPDYSRGVLTCYHRYDLLDRFQNGDDGYPKAVLDLVDTSRLSHLVNITFRRLDAPLLSAFIERWQPDTNTFHMPFGEMTILLHDVERILGLPIDGRMCSGTSTSSSSGIAALFGMTDEELGRPLPPNTAAICKGGGVTTEAITKLTSSRPDVTVQAQGYLMLLLGSTLFVDKSGFRIKTCLYELVKDVSKVQDYALGAGTLAYLYRQLGIASRLDCRGIAGCLTLLQAWIYEYFPMFRPSVAAFVPLASGQPRAAAYTCLSRFENTAEKVRSYRQRLDSLTLASPNWMPYGPDMHVHHPQTIFFGCIRFFDIVEPYQPDRCLRQLGFRQVIPEPMPRPSCQFRTGKSQTYRVEFDSFTDHLWTTWRQHMCGIFQTSAPAATPTESSDDYIEWFLNHSHPYLCPVRHNVAPDNVQGLVEIGAALGSSFSQWFELSPVEQFAHFQHFMAEHQATLRRVAGRGRGRGPAPTRGRGDRARGLGVTGTLQRRPNV